MFLNPEQFSAFADAVPHIEMPTVISLPARGCGHLWYPWSTNADLDQNPYRNFVQIPCRD